MADVARALVLEAPRQLADREVPLPEIADDDGLLRVEACGLCGTDHEQYTGQLWGGFAFVPGHETVGVIEAIGPVAAERWGVSVGDRVALAPFQSCRECESCQAGRYRGCRSHGLADMLGFIPVDRAPGLWGGYATHHYLSPDSVVLPVPPSLDPVLATLFNPVGAGIRWGVSVPRTRAGDVVAVLGPGIRGLSVCAAAKHAGAGFVMVTGVSPHDDERLSLASEFGADLAVDVTTRDPVKALREVTGRGADVVVDVTAKAPAALAQAVKLARPGGRIVLAGTRGTTDTPGFSPDEVVFKELKIYGALGVDLEDFQDAFALLESGRYPTDVPRWAASLGEAEDLVRTMAGESGRRPPLHGVVTPALM